MINPAEYGKIYTVIRMIDFAPLNLEQKQLCDSYLRGSASRGCGYSFVNLYLWGRQKVGFVAEHLVCFSQYSRKSVYGFPAGQGDVKPAVDAVIADAKERGIPCRMIGLSKEDCALLESLYPGKFRFHNDRDFFDYVYDIHDLADLKGRKYQKKRNHLNRFRQENPDFELAVITEDNLPAVEALVQKWYDQRLRADPLGDFHMEQAALKKALKNMAELGLEGLLLSTEKGPVAMTLGSFLSDDTFDVHFEKALDIADGAYPAINHGFANCLREKYPQLQFLNREDDMGLAGLRKAKESYCPHHMVEKYWACLLEDGYDY